jgi:hypothetical protein
VNTQPIGLYTEDKVTEDGHLTRTFLSYPKYHQHEDGAWHESDCTIQESQDPDWEVS